MIFTIQASKQDIITYVQRDRQLKQIRFCCLSILNLETTSNSNLVEDNHATTFHSTKSSLQKDSL